MLFNSSAEKLTCSSAEKMKALKLIEIILNMRDRAGQDGILSLEEYISDEKLPFLLRKGIQNYMDGVELEINEKTLSYYIELGDYSGIELLIRLICKEAALLFHKGYGSNNVERVLLAMLGEEFNSTAVKHLSNRRKGFKLN